MTERARAICPRGPDGQYREGWTFRPAFDWLLRVEGLSVIDCHVYGVLANASAPEASSVRLGMRELARRGGISERAARYGIEALERAGLLEVDRRENGRARESTYTFLEHAQNAVPANRAGTEQAAVPANRAAKYRQTVPQVAANRAAKYRQTVPHSVEILGREELVEGESAIAGAPAELPLAPSPSEQLREGETRPPKPKRKTRERDELVEQIRDDWCVLHADLLGSSCAPPPRQDASDMAKLCRADAQRHNVSARGLASALMYAYLSLPRTRHSLKWLAQEPAQAMRTREFAVQLSVERKADAKENPQPTAADTRQTTIAEIAT